MSNDRTEVSYNLSMTSLLCVLSDLCVEVKSIVLLV
jgi:hypothetical protein